MRTRVMPKECLKSVTKEDWVDINRRPYVKGDTAWIPVKDGFFFDCILDKKKGYLGRGYHMAGDIAIFHGDVPDKKDLDELIRWENPSCILHIHSYEGVRRIPKINVLYGKPKEICLKENGCFFIFDPSKVMFAMGNREEKRRIAEIVKKGERIADMFAGIGYFTIPAAVSGADIHAMEINPDSFLFLKRNIEKNRVEENVISECGDCRDLLKGEYDRAFMGHFESYSMLPDILSHMKRNSTLHVHSINDISAKISKECQIAGFKPDISLHRVKKYAPHKWHVVQDVVLL